MTLSPKKFVNRKGTTLAVGTDAVSCPISFSLSWRRDKLKFIGHFQPNCINVLAVGRVADVTSSVSTRNSRGYSVVEILIVVTMIGVLSGMAIPQIIAERRLSRTVAMTREIQSQLRLARQHAMSERQAFTFQYNDTTKRVSIIDHNINTGAALLSTPGFPNTPGSTVVTSVPLATGGLAASEIMYGIPGTITPSDLRDGAPMTALTSGMVNITFQPDGSVVDETGDPKDRALFFFNSGSPEGTASAVSVMGASGRIKIWRYNRVADVYND